MSDRKFRFGVSGRGDSAAEWREFARKAEDLGYSTLQLPDHFSRQMAPLLALTAAAQVTSTLRFGTTVLANSFRHPVVLAKEIATIDVLSEGRFELGIGTGSQDRDNVMAGMPVEPGGVRVERLTETLAILKQFFSQEEVNFQGKYYQVAELPAYPRPYQPGGPPVFIGAGGDRMLRLAAREADIVGIMGPAEEYGRKLGVVKKAAGERYDEIVFNQLNFRVQVDGKPDLPSDPRFTDMPGSMIGSVDSIVEHLQKQREEQDISYILVIGPAIDAFAPVVAKLNGQ